MTEVFLPIELVEVLMKMAALQFQLHMKGVLVEGFRVWPPAMLVTTVFMNNGRPHHH